MEIIAATAERFKYNPQQGWNLEIEVPKSSRPTALYRYVKQDSEGTNFTSLKVACNLTKACFVIDPPETPGDSFRGDKAYTISELRFHMKRKGLPSVPNAEEMLKLMRTNAQEERETSSRMSKAALSLVEPILAEAGLVRGKNWPWGFEGVKGAGIGNCGLVDGSRAEARYFQLDQSQPIDVLESMKRRFPGNLVPDQRIFDWYKSGEYADIWSVVDPEKLLEQNFGLVHSSLLLRFHHREPLLPMNHLIIRVAAEYPMGKALKQMAAQYFEEPSYGQEQSVRDYVYNIAA